ncbi:IS1182 family transposase [Methanosalsum natronophilum]|uniref:IS1182 family transposase n=1 Tax=Methanosalsum natronophilum TaxID=768733 RepID=A0A424Z0M3_9EURY|nr:MAG: IS1182 family transposase [Methanosalsum natronophilum]
MTQWANSTLSRDQIILFSPTLDSSIEEDHPARLFDEILTVLDWSSWESRYCSGKGQPAIHPKTVASAILYGMSHGIRSSRRLEWACKNAIDFIWLVEGRQIDHSTFCNFRNRFKKELKGIFRQLGRIAMTMGMVRLNQIALDGTKIKANCNRKGATAETIESRIQNLDEQIDKWFAESETIDKKDGVLFEDTGGSATLPRELAGLHHRRALLQQALEAARQVDAVRQKRSDRPKTPAAVPVADPESRIMPNKEGGFAANYTPVNAVDGEQGYIMDTEVIAGNDETAVVAKLIDQIETDFEKKPEEVLADALFAKGSTLQEFEDRDIKAYIPVETGVSQNNNPAERDDLTMPVPQKDWPKLPRSPHTNKLDRSAFIYQSHEDCYYCPMGKQITFSFLSSYKKRNSELLHVRNYQCGYCFRCALKAECLRGKSQYRTVTRDQYQDLRENAIARMKSEKGRKNYGRRMWIAEGTFGLIKSWMGFRQFLCRGLEKVRTEWLWVCTAFNLKKLVKAISVLRKKYPVTA